MSKTTPAATRLTNGNPLSTFDLGYLAGTVDAFAGFSTPFDAVSDAEWLRGWSAGHASVAS